MVALDRVTCSTVQDPAARECKWYEILDYRDIIRRPSCKLHRSEEFAPGGTSYQYRVVASNRFGESPSNVASVKFDVVGGGWDTLTYKYILIDWLIPNAKRIANRQFKIEVEAGTGFQINATSGSNPRKCNWDSPPKDYTQWSSLGASFYLVRCKIGTGEAYVKVKGLGSPRRVKFRYIQRPFMGARGSVMAPCGPPG